MDIMEKWLLQPVTVLLKMPSIIIDCSKSKPTAVGHETRSILSPCWRTREQTAFDSSSLFLPWEVKVHAGGFDLWQTNLLNQTFRFSNISYQLCLWLTGVFVFFSMSSFLSHWWNCDKSASREDFLLNDPSLFLFLFLMIDLAKAGVQQEIHRPVGKEEECIVMLGGAQYCLTQESKSFVSWGFED